MDIDEQLEVAEIPEHTYAIADPATIDLIIQLKAIVGTQESHKEEIYHYTVSRAVVTHVSKVFANMVDNDHPMRSLKRKKMPTDESDVRYFLDLYDDDPADLCAVLSAFHLKTDTDDYNLRELVRLVKLCDKYDCIKAVSPWLKNMMSTISYSAWGPGNEGWLYLCVKLGVSDKFEESTREIAVELAIEQEEDAEGKRTVYKRVFRDACGEYDIDIDIDLIPEVVWNGIIERRNKMLEDLSKMTKLFPKRFEDFLSDGTCYEYCNGICYGTYALSVQKDEMWNYINLSPEERLAINPTSSPSPGALNRSWKKATWTAQDALGSVDHSDVLDGDDDRCANYNELDCHLMRNKLGAYLEDNWRRALRASEYIRPL